MNLFEQLTKSQQMYVVSIRKIGREWGYDLTKTNWTRSELVAISMKRQGNDDVPNWIVKDQSRRVSRGVYSIPEVYDVSPGHETDGDGLSDSTATPEEINTVETETNDTEVVGTIQATFEGCDGESPLVDTATVMGDG